MTLGQVKKTALALIEEYAPDNDLLTDEDIQTINLLLVQIKNYHKLKRLILLIC